VFFALLLSGEPGKETKPNEGSSLRATIRLPFVAPHVGFFHLPSLPLFVMLNVPSSTSYVSMVMCFAALSRDHPCCQFHSEYNLGGEGECGLNFWKYR